MFRRSLLVLGLVLVAALLAGACAPAGQQEADDLLSQIKKEGKLRVSTDPAYPPQSFLDDDGQMKGFDIDVATEIAQRLGVEVQWETPAWDLLVAGSWQDRWDVSVGSMTITPERQEVLHFTRAYYFTPAAVAVHKDNTSINDVAADLDGKKVGVCGGCTYEFYLDKSLSIPGEEIEFVVDDAQVTGYDTDSSAIQDLALGDGVRLDAVISALPTLKAAVDEGLAIKIAGDPVFYEPLAVAVDKEAGADPTGFVEELDRIIGEMHQDGTLTELSLKWYGVDLTKKQQ